MSDIRIKFILFVSLLSLTACTSVVDTMIPLSKNFEKDAEVAILKIPNWRAFDSVYNQKIGSYSIQNSKTTGERLRRNLVRMSIEGNFLNYLLFDDEFQHVVKEFNVEGVQRFSFDLTQNGVVQATSKCEIFSKSLHTQNTTDSIVRLDRNKYEQSNFIHREKTFLICSIDQLNGHWGLTLKSYKDKPLVVKFSSEHQSYSIKEVSQYQDILSNGEKRSVPPWLSQHAGLKFYGNNQQVSALSFFRKPKIWITNALSAKDKALMLSVNYSLLMFNWLDGEWRK